MSLKATDPEAIEQANLRLGDKGDKLQYLEHPYETLENADALLLLTEWSEFRNPDFELIRKKLKSPVIFDGRNIFPKSEMEKMGFAYYPIGSAPTTHARRSASTT